MAEINITPFTDVVLVLLIIFMVTTPLILQSGIKVKLPQASTVETQSGKSITINISADGKIYLKNTSVTLAELKDEISSQLASKPDSVVVINADKDVKYNEVVAVLDISKQAGAQRLALSTEYKKK
jgi:biopolymer transport protein ExbD